MQKESFIETITEDKESLLGLLNGEESQLNDILELIRKDGISEKTYAQVFRVLFWKTVKTKDRISYDTVEKMWYRGDHQISDMEVISVFAEAVYFIRKCVGYCWKICQYGALSPSWIDTKEFAKAELSMDSMESFTKLRACLKFAGAIMPLEEPNTAQIDWDAICGEGEDGEESPLSNSAVKPLDLSMGI